MRYWIRVVDPDSDSDTACTIYQTASLATLFSSSGGYPFFSKVPPVFLSWPLVLVKYFADKMQRVKGENGCWLDVTKQVFLIYAHQTVQLELWQEIELLC